MSAASTVSRRILSLFLPRLSTDRLIRAERGRSWRSAASPDAGAVPHSAAARPGDVAAAADAVASGATRLARRIGQATWVPPAETASAGGRLPPGTPIAVVARSGGALRLAAVDAVASARGLAPGLGLADARAMVPDLMVTEADEAGDAALLERIADWCDRYTPLVAVDPASPAGLFLEIGGSAHLFGGEAALAADMVARLAAQGFAAAVGIASTPGAAWAAAHCLDHPGWTTPHLHAGALAGSAPRPALRPAGFLPAGFLPVRILEPGAERTALAPLPLGALRLAPETVAGLERVGLKTVGAVVDLPRAPLGRRFGPELADRLDRALGRLDEPISPRRPVPDLVAERRFAEPILSEGDVAQVIRSLAGHLAAPLEARGLGARALELALFRVDGAVTRLAVGASRPLRDPDRIAALFAERIARLADGLDAGFGFETLHLAVLQADPDTPRQVDLAGTDEAEAELGHLVDRLGARLGPARVTRPLPQETHIPEAAALPVPARRADTAGTAWREEPRGGPDDPVERPVRLFLRPEPIEAVAEVPEGPPIRFRWRRATYAVARYEGPERIAAEWWRHALPSPENGDPSPESGETSPESGEPWSGLGERPAAVPGAAEGATPGFAAATRAGAGTPDPRGHPPARPAGTPERPHSTPSPRPAPAPRRPAPSRTSGEVHAARHAPPGEARDHPGDRPAPDRPPPGAQAGGSPRSRTAGDAAPIPPSRPAARPGRPAETRGPSPTDDGRTPWSQKEPPLDGTRPDDALPPGTPGLTRDYYRVEDDAGRRFWVFREGLYGSETARPRWFVQGLFA